MTKRRAQTFLFWLLPILVLRALMPVGMMFDTSDSGAVIVMCSGDSYQGGTRSSNDNSGSWHSHASQHGDQHSICPFAVALAAAVTVHNTIEVDSSFMSAESATETTSPQSTYGPTRINLTRGPPSFS